MAKDKKTQESEQKEKPDPLQSIRVSLHTEVTRLSRHLDNMEQKGNPEAIARLAEAKVKVLLALKECS